MLTWEQRQETIKAIFQDYSIQDIANSFLCCNLWLPNISSQIKHIYLTALFLSCKPAIFKKDNQISDYKKFSEFISRLIPLLPSFPAAEDYSPESDWGEVKFFFNEKIYRIFYGNEITDIYDYLSMFEIMYVPVDDKYTDKINRSPSAELAVCLNIQDQILSYIPQSISKEKLESIDIGHYEIPGEQFWQGVNDFIHGAELAIPEAFVKNYSVQAGSISFPSSEGFIEAIIYGRLAQYFFLAVNGATYLLNPRRYSCILLEEWYQLYKTNKDSLYEKKEQELFYSSAVLGRYMSQRIKGHNKFTVVSAVHENSRPHETVFSFATIHENKLLLFCLLTPGESNLEKKVIEIEEALSLIRKQPHTLGLHLKRQNVQFHSKEDHPIDFGVVLIYPNMCIQGMVNSVKIPKSFTGTFIGITDFLGICDEVQSIEEFIEFFEYIENDDTPLAPMSSLMDRYAAFKDSNKIIIGGARDFDWIMLDPHWGTAFKYERLKKFWGAYPDRNYFDHPRSWLPIRESETRIRLDARGYRGCALLTKINGINIFFTAPFDDMNYEEARITDMLLMCLEGYFSKASQTLIALKVFQQYKEFNINIFPDTLIKREGDKFKHLNKFVENLTMYAGQAGLIQRERPGVRMAYSLSDITKNFMECTDNANEIDLFSYVVSLFNGLLPDAKMNDLLRKIRSIFQGHKPRYKLYQINMGVCFDHFSGSPILAESYDLKKARKEVARIAKNLNIEPGEYNLDEAKKLINAVRVNAVKAIDTSIVEFDFKDAVKFLMRNLERLMHHTKADLELIEKSTGLEVDYDRSERYAQIHSDYLSTHKNYRYLIEKFIQHSATGIKKLQDNDVRNLLAFCDEIHVFYEASDLLHYGISPLGLNVSDDYLFRIKSKYDTEDRGKSYGELLATHQIYSDTNEGALICNKEEIEQYLDELDSVFKSEFGFKFRNVLYVCDVLATWPNFHKDDSVSDMYSANADVIAKACISHLKDGSEAEVQNVINMLLLDRENILSIIGDKNSSDDLPVWEINKRPYRYIVKPLIKIDQRIIWGPYSIDKAQKNWLNRVMDGDVPFDLQNTNIADVIDKRKQKIEQRIVEETFKIIDGKTSFVDKEVFLHKRNKNAGHPVDLGDYDVIAFFPKAGILLNVECKDLLGGYCPKDAKRIRDRLFGSKKGDGYVGKVECREAYLIKNWSNVFKTLKWPECKVKEIEIKSLFISRNYFYWYMYPPYKVDIRFEKISTLSKFLDELLIENV